MPCMPVSPGRQAVLSAEAPRRAVTLDEVRAHRDAIIRLGQRFGVRNIRVFGSVVRGEAIPGSDLDLHLQLSRDAPSRPVSDPIWLRQVRTCPVLDAGETPRASLGAGWR